MPRDSIVTGQDFKNVVFSNRKTTEKKALPPRAPGAAALRKLEEEVPLTKVTTEQKQTLQKLRIDAGYKTQKLLADATKGKINSARICELESGKGLAPNGIEKQILFRLVKMKF